MSKPEDIPQDVWEKAEDPAQACFDGAVDLYETGIESSSLQLVIARAIMAERDRCAGIAFCAYQNKTELCSKIIRRIRSGEGLVR